MVGFFLQAYYKLYYPSLINNDYLSSFLEQELDSRLSDIDFICFLISVLKSPPLK